MGRKAAVSPWRLLATGALLRRFSCCWPLTLRIITTSYSGGTPSPPVFWGIYRQKRGVKSSPQPRASLRHPSEVSLGCCARGFLPPTQREVLSTESLLLRRLPIHHGGPLGSIGRHLEHEVVRRCRRYLHREPPLNGRAAHLFVAGPCPSIAIDRAPGVFELTPTVEFAIGERLVNGGISQHRQTHAIAHLFHLEIGVANQEKAPVHPLALLQFHHRPARAHRPWLHVTIERPRARHYVQLLQFRSGLGCLHLRHRRRRQRQANPQHHSRSLHMLSPRTRLGFS